MKDQVFSTNKGVFKSTQKAKRLPHGVIAIIIVILLMFLGQIVGSIALLPFRPIIKWLWESNGLQVEAITFAIGLTASFGGMTLLFFGWVRMIEKRKIGTMGFTRDTLVNKYSKGFLLGVLMMGSIVIVFWLLGMIEMEDVQSTNVGISALPGVLIVLIGWLVQGGTEEIMVRGWLLPVIGVRHNMIAGILISSSIFGALHLLNDHISILAIINLILFGVFAALYMMYDKSLWGVCGLHSSWNWVQGNIFGFEVSGSLAKGGSLLRLSTIGPDLMTGGFFGPEGGLVVTLVLGIGIGFLLAILIKRASKEVL